MEYGHMGIRGEGFLSFLLFVVLILAIIALVRHFMGKGPLCRLPQSESALEILNKRYARGEISKEEYDRVKSDLS